MEKEEDLEMTETFKASNGWYIDKSGNVCNPSGFFVITVGELKHVAQLSQEKRDAELGRWRDTVEPHIVCYSRGRDYVRVTSERSGEYWEFKRGKVVAASTAECVAERYFQAHPVHKPWSDAKPGEVWVMRRQSDGYARAYIATDYGTFEAPCDEYAMSDPEFVEGHCIYPVESEVGE